MVLLQHLEVDPGLVVVAVDICGGVQLHQVPVAGVVLRQQDKVVVLVPELCACLYLPGALRHVELTSYYRLYPVLPALLVEVQGPEHVPVVCYGYG